MSNRKNKYINKDDYTSIMNNMSNSDVNKDDTPVSTKTMRTVLIILYLCSILYFFMLFVNLKKLFMSRNNEKTPKISHYTRVASAWSYSLNKDLPLRSK